MRGALKIASWLALAGVVLPPFLYFHGTLDHATLKMILLPATVVWFVATPFWMNHRAQS
jgi:hypothetical protein